MTYIPSFDNNSCIVTDNVYNGYIRVYSSTPTANSTINYVDYFINSDYIERVGSQEFGNWNYTVNCQPHDNFTTNFYYRTDFDSILIIFFVFVFFIIFLPYKVMSRAFGRWLKV